jgi:hypothetical protein
MPVAPFLYVWLVSSRASRRWGLDSTSDLLRERPSRWNGAVGAGLFAMVAVCVIQFVAVGQWLAFVSLFPIGMFTFGAYLRWPVWVDLVVSLATVLVGYVIDSGNVILAGWLVLRWSVFLVLLLGAARVLERRRQRPVVSEGAGLPAVG